MKPRLKKSHGMWWCGLPWQPWVAACNPRDAYRLWVKCNKCRDLYLDIGVHQHGDRNSLGC